MTVVRGQHHVDEPVVGGSLNERRLTVKPWLHRRRPGGEWELTNFTVGATASAPPDWSGVYEGTRGSFGGNLGVSVGDRTDASNRSLVTFRREDEPGAWCNLKIVSVTIGGVASPPGSAEPQADGANGVRWPGLVGGSDATLLVGGGTAKWQSTHEPGAYPTEILFSVKFSGPPHGIALVDGEIVLSRAGETKIRVRAPHCWDSDAGAADPLLGGKTLPSAWEDRGTSGGLRYFALVLDPSTAVGTITIDPTTVVDAVGALDMNNLYAFWKTYNYGGSPTVLISGSRSEEYCGILRIPSIYLPAGNYSSFTLGMAEAGAGPWVYPTAFWPLTDAVSNWIEGTANGADQQTSSNWYARIGGIPAWSYWNAGCAKGVDTDYRSAEKMSITPGTSGGYKTFPLNPAWATNWSQGIWQNSGLRFRDDRVEGVVTTAFRTDDWATAPAYVELVYTTLDPTITSVSPEQTGAGTIEFVITGTNFTGTTDVTVAGFSTAFVVDSPTQISTELPYWEFEGNYGWKAVQVTTLVGPSNSDVMVEYVPPASITDVLEPAVGAYLPQLTITGANFEPGTTVGVKVAGFAPVYSCTNVVIVSPALLTCDAPIAQMGAGQDQTWYAYVYAPVGGGEGGDDAKASFVFTHHVTMVGLLTPDTGSSNGGTAISAGAFSNDTFLQYVRDVKIGGASCTDIVYHAAPPFPPGQKPYLTMVTPAGTAGAQDWTYIDPGGFTTFSVPFQFTYLQGVEFSSIVPAIGPVAGGWLVTIYGAGFSTLVALTLDGVPLTSINVVSDNELTAVIPAGSP